MPAAAGSSHVDEAAREFETAIATARRQNAHLYHLRAAVSLAKLYQSTSHDAQALAVLGPALDSFEWPARFSTRTNADATSPCLTIASELVPFGGFDK